MDLLRCAIDTHVHSFPDVIARKLDDIALVEQARAAGMRGVLLKAHVFSTSAVPNQPRRALKLEAA